MDSEMSSANEETRSAWEANAKIWDARMGDEGNDFFRILQWPVITEFLDTSSCTHGNPPSKILDVACGNGLTSRKLADLGADVLAFDFSENLIEKARGRSNPGGRIEYRVVDGSDEQALLELGRYSFDAALCNMALFDMADIEPLFKTLPSLLKPCGCFVFSLLHPAFNNSSSVHTAEEEDLDGVITTTYSVKVSRYMTPYQAQGTALRDQPKPQLYFERPLEYYMKMGFKNGFVLDAFAERAFPTGSGLQPSHPLSWSGQFSEIPPVLVARMRLK